MDGNSTGSLHPLDTWICRYALDLGEHEHIGRTTGILLFGSQARQTADPTSDYDLIVLSEKPGKLSLEREGRNFDITCDTKSNLTHLLHKESTWNNNFVLNALSQGVVLREDSVLSALIEEAKRIRSAGPKSMTGEFAARSLVALERMHQSAAERLTRPYQDGSIAALTAKMRADQTASRATYLYFMAQGEWTDALPELLRQCRQRFPAHYDLWQTYATAAGNDCTIPLAALVHSTCYLLRAIASP